MGDPVADTAEHQRLREEESRGRNWKRWGPYLAERQWATVREDYSAPGDAWGYFPHEQARSRTYRWGEDGLLGWTDRECRLCFALALWNGRDAILKERLFGLTGPQGNHGEDVKECYYYLAATPTYSYARALYKYPHAAYPYEALVEGNRKRGLGEPELELADLGMFDGDRYCDVQVEYAKDGENDTLIRVRLTNRGPEMQTLHVLPTVWFRNTWFWGSRYETGLKPSVQQLTADRWLCVHPTLGRLHFHLDTAAPGFQRNLFTENETNQQRLFNVPNRMLYTKDAFHDHVIGGLPGIVNPSLRGTKAAAHYRLELGPFECRELRFRLAPDTLNTGAPLGTGFVGTFLAREQEMEAFYRKVEPPNLTDTTRPVWRQAHAGLLWSKQFYHFVVSEWLDGDTRQPSPPRERLQGRNCDWRHLFARDVLSMPDKWEYPWFAAWDLAFHLVPFARTDPAFAKQQALLLLREWYLHPSGQLPAYEFNFSDVNPPVHAWACWRIYKISAPSGERDVAFLERTFQKLLLNFTWWVNRKDPNGDNVFGGGFLGLDNIGVFDRSKPLPAGTLLAQADGTAWMAFYCGTMLAMALELALHNRAYEDIASKFFEHYIAIVDAMNSPAVGLWDETDGFYYDQLRRPDGHQPLRIRSMVGLIPLFAATVIPSSTLAALPDFRKRLNWFLTHRVGLAQHIQSLSTGDPNVPDELLLSIPSRRQFQRILSRLLDPAEFLSPFGIRSLSRTHEKMPFVFHWEGQTHRVDYVPGEGNSHLFGGNSNWRGPIWFPVNLLLVEALERYHYFYGPGFRVECRREDGTAYTLDESAREIARRLCALFVPDATGARPCHGGENRYASDPAWQELILYYEYFHAETGRGLGASHQTGWTALVAELFH